MGTGGCLVNENYLLFWLSYYLGLGPPPAGPPIYITNTYIIHIYNDNQGIIPPSTLRSTPTKCRPTVLLRRLVRLYVNNGVI
jgi:hypothetical protein